MATPSQKQISTIDLRQLTQTDIQSLATSNTSVFNLETLNAIIPILDPSTFNESAGSRKQTFSRLPLNPNTDSADIIPTPNPRRRGRPQNLNPNPKTPNDDAGHKENLQIVSLLKNLFDIREKGEIFGKLDREVRNLKGEVIDLEELGKKEDIFEAEIRKRTEGLEKEEQLLGYMTGLDGEWGSRRKRRKTVDAGLFGCDLPKGWKILLWLKKKDGGVFLNCRKYVSPSGKHFATCKEVSSYILSLNGQQDSSKPNSGQPDFSASRTDKLALESETNQTHKDINKRELVNCSYVAPISYVSTECEKQGQLFKVKNAKPYKSLQCRKCNLTFGDKDAQVQHLSTFHGGAKRRRFGHSITEGVIMKDGKYECQFCHKTFTERFRYNGHIGAHVRYEGLKEGDENITEETKKSPVQSEVNVSSNGNKEVSLNNDSTNCISGSDSKEIEHNLKTDACTEHVSPTKKIDSQIEGGNRYCGDMKEIASNTNDTDMSSKEVMVNNDTMNNDTSSPVKNEVAITSNSIHDPNNESELTYAKSGILEDLNADNGKSNTYQNDLPSSSYENCNIRNSDHIMVNYKQETHSSSPDHIMVTYKTETHVDTSKEMSTDIPNEIIDFSSRDNIEGAQINECDITAYNYNTNAVGTSNTTNVETNECINALSPLPNHADNTNFVNLDTSESNDGDQNETEEHHLLSFSGNEPNFGVETYGNGFFTSKVKEIVESDDYMHEKTAITSTMRSELDVSCDFPNIANEPTSGIETNADCMFPGDLNKSLLDDIDNVGYEFQNYFHSRNTRNENLSGNIMHNNVEGQSQVNIADQSSSWMQSSDGLNFLDLMPDQNMQRNEQTSISGFDDLTLGSIEPSDFALFTGQSSTSVTRSPMELFPDSQLEWGMSLNKIPTNTAPTSICVWCGREFSLEGYDIEPQSENLGYICPDCKAKISGQFGMYGFS